MDASQARRFEWKYCVPRELAGELSAALEPRVGPDAYCTGPDCIYRVRSLYYDTRDLRFYHEGKDGLKIRRKVRVRSYGTPQYFLEIKRKLDEVTVKERVPVPGSRLVEALNGVDPAVVLADRSPGDLRTLERFRSILITLGLVPTLLVTYVRRAMVGRNDPHLRITLDRDLRGRTRPGPNALDDEGKLFAFEPRHVLELKFNRRPPRWLMDIVARFHLKRVPYSKYCEGIDRCPMEAASVADRPGEAPPWPISFAR